MKRKAAKAKDPVMPDWDWREVREDADEESDSE